MVLDTTPGTTRLRALRPDLLLCGAVLAAILLVQGWNTAGFPALSDDEGTYLAQAWAVQEGKGLAHYTYWYDHPPLGWLQLALVTWLPAALFPDVMSVAPMRIAMLLVTAVSAVLLYVLARRLGLRRWAAALAMALFGLSPLAVVLQREIFLDNIAVLWILLAFCLAASPRRHLWHHFGAGLAAGVAVLTKETMLVVLPALLVTMWRHTHRDTRKFAVTGAITACVLTGLAYPLFALLNHELFPGDGHVSLLGGIKYQMGRAGSGFILDGGSGAHAVLRSWLYYDRVLPLAGLAAAILLLAAARWSHTARTLAGPATAVVILALVALRPSGYLPAMYVIQLLPFLALTVAGAASIQPLRRLRSGGPGAEPLEETGRGGAGANPTHPRRPALLRRAAALTLAVTAAAVVTPHWYDATRTALTTDANAPYRAAAHWLRERGNVPDPSRTRVLADDAIWLDLVHAGYRPGTGAVWFYKADLDPAIAKTMPRGWRDVDYVVASPTVRRDAPTLPLVKAALTNSETVASFGEGDGRIEIRKVTRAGAR
ncbi:glycosyltransferase family 39 protein [Streptomyces sp. DSM 40473]|uniref:Glycosyltransferase family 39 protein n=1 Tax=Streptomyces hesseae TaxID=3075519 RepID=A0ABU2SRT9_9ACTN|nr:glycosyltransferase family 39 protein [Streptomyces sp. DSM 40473]MDT0451585.1 glycosyltransferase family 39 protein [Streptomyces sp. DSM 40473]